MIRLGVIENRTAANFKQYNVIKEDCNDNVFLKEKRTQHGNIVTSGHNKLQTTLELDFVTDAIESYLYDNTLRSKYLKMFMRHPADTATQVFNYNGISNPSSTHAVKYIESDTADLGYSGTEVSNSEYLQIKEIDTGTFNELFKYTSAYDYQYIFLRFKPAAFDYTTLFINRVSLFLHNPYCINNYNSTPPSEPSGFVISAFNSTNYMWSEVGRVECTTENATLITNLDMFQYCAVLKPGLTWFTKFEDYFDASGYMYFRMRNIYPRKSKVGIGFNFAELLINAWPVSWTGNVDFNYRDNVTLSGKTAKILLSEI
jgi:hypothetical protein